MPSLGVGWYLSIATSYAARRELRKDDVKWAAGETRREVARFLSISKSALQVFTGRHPSHHASLLQASDKLRLALGMIQVSMTTSEASI